MQPVVTLIICMGVRHSYPAQTNTEVNNVLLSCHTATKQKIWIKTTEKRINLLALFHHNTCSLEKQLKTQNDLLKLPFNCHVQNDMP